MNFALLAQPFIVQCGELIGGNLKNDFLDLYAVYSTPCTEESVKMYFQDHENILNHIVISKCRDIDDLINIYFGEIYWNEEIFKKYIKRTVR